MEVGRHQGMITNEHITKGRNYYENVITFKYFGYLLTNHNSIREEIKFRLKTRNSSNYSIQTHLSSQLLSKNLKIKIYKTIILPVMLYGRQTWYGILN